VAARALLSAFASLIWKRDLAERLFGYQHVLELYVPAANRRYGYHVLPFLAGETFAAQGRPEGGQANRNAARAGVYLEPGPQPGQTAAELAAELRSIAYWLSLESIQVSERGDLAAHLRDAVAGPAA
jgi:uncharacterized protein